MVQDPIGTIYTRPPIIVCAAADWLADSRLGTTVDVPGGSASSAYLLIRFISDTSTLSLALFVVDFLCVSRISLTTAWLRYTLISNHVARLSPRPRGRIACPPCNCANLDFLQPSQLDQLSH